MTCNDLLANLRLRQQLANVSELAPAQVLVLMIARPGLAHN